MPHSTQQKTPDTGALSAQAFDLLVALADGAQHARTLATRIQSAPGSQARILTGTVQGLLRQLTNRGWVEEAKASVWDEDARLKHYKLSQAGAAVAQARVAELQAWLQEADMSVRRALPPLVPFG